MVECSHQKDTLETDINKLSSSTVQPHSFPTKQPSCAALFICKKKKNKSGPFKYIEVSFLFIRVHISWFRGRNECTTVMVIYVRPHLETCAPVWSPHGKISREQLEKVQRGAMRWICDARQDKTLHQWTKHHDIISFLVVRYTRL